MSATTWISKTSYVNLPIFLLLISIPSVCLARTCFKCQFLPHPRVCTILSECGTGESCYVEEFTVVSTGRTLFRSGCTKTQQCHQSQNVSVQIVGKRGLSKRHYRRNCFECCDHDFCNIEGCGFQRIPSVLTGPFCYHCYNISNPINCHKAILCPRHEVCSFQEMFSGHAYDMKCMYRDRCNQLSHSYVGGSCSPLCCDTDFCNRHCAKYIRPVTNVITTTTRTTTISTKITTHIQSTSNTPSTSKVIQVHFTKAPLTPPTTASSSASGDSTSSIPFTSSTVNVTTPATPLSQMTVTTTTLSTKITTHITSTTNTPSTSKVIQVHFTKAPLTPSNTSTSFSTISRTTNSISSPTVSTTASSSASGNSTSSIPFTSSTVHVTTPATPLTPMTVKTKTPKANPMTSTVTESISPNTTFDIERACRKLLFEGYYYDSFTKLCIRVEKVKLTQTQAARACAVDGASLMVVDKAAKQDLLIYWIFSHRENDTDFWIGAKAAKGNAQNFKWVDGSEISLKTYSNWGNYLMGQPDDRRVKNENCVYMDYVDNYFWHDDNCSETKTGYICEIGPLAFPQAEYECRRHVFDGYYYDHKTNFCIMLRTKQHVTHDDAAAACAKDNAHLVKIDTDSKTNFLLTWIFSNQINATDFWIGATDKYDNSTFYWSDGIKIQYTHWGGPNVPPKIHGQPDEPTVKDQDCVYMDYIHNYFWFDDDCQNKRNGFICEIPDKGHLAMLCRSHFSEGYFYDYYSNICIKLHRTTGVTQQQANVSCHSEAAKLVTIDDERKTNFVLSWIFSHGINDTDFWIGAKDIYNTSHFYWPSGSKLTYSHWFTVNVPPKQECVILDHKNNYKWLPAQCDQLRAGYVCEVNKHTLASYHDHSSV